MQKRTVAEIMLAAVLLTGAAYFLLYTENGREWMDRLKNTATDQLDNWLADLESFLQEMEFGDSRKEPSELS